MKNIEFRALAVTRGKDGSLDGEPKWFNNVYTDGETVLIDTKHQGIKPLKCVTALVQWTGLVDKEGVKIYNDDIVRWGMNGVECLTRYAKVILQPSLGFEIIYYLDEKTDTKKSTDGHIFGYWNFIYRDTEKHLEVIGNIHQHKHLLIKD